MTVEILAFANQEKAKLVGQIRATRKDDVVSVFRFTLAGSALGESDDVALMGGQSWRGIAYSLATSLSWGAVKPHTVHFYSGDELPEIGEELVSLCWTRRGYAGPCEYRPLLGLSDEQLQLARRFYGKFTQDGCAAPVVDLRNDITMLRYALYPDEDHFEPWRFLVRLTDCLGIDYDAEVWPATMMRLRSYFDGEESLYSQVIQRVGAALETIRGKKRKGEYWSKKRVHAQREQSVRDIMRALLRTYPLENSVEVGPGAVADLTGLMRPGRRR